MKMRNEEMIMRNEEMKMRNEEMKNVPAAHILDSQAISSFLISISHSSFLISHLHFLISHLHFLISHLQLNDPFNYEPHPLALLAARQVKDYLCHQQQWHEELSAGKMLGVLVCKDHHGTLGFLAAYSGQLGGRADWPWFVPAVFDYLQPDGYFKQEEARISDLNRQVDSLENSYRLNTLRSRLRLMQAEATHEVDAYREMIHRSKQQRDAAAQRTPEMTRESQFQKAELRRLKKRWEERLAGVKADVEVIEKEIRSLRQERKKRSDALQRWLFSQFVMLNGAGERCSLTVLFAPTPQGVPPSGAGECCAPKLLQYAFLYGLTPLAIAEFWYGRSPRMEIRHDGQFYPACQGKCKPILQFMLQGVDVAWKPMARKHLQLDIIYEDQHIVVVNKPAGMLSVPGKSGDTSVAAILSERYPQAEGPVIVHRLDMDTSGLMVAALTEHAYHRLQEQFLARTVTKNYVAVAEPKIQPSPLHAGFHTHVALPLRPDVDDRPRQMVDFDHGKKAVTDVLVLSAAAGRVRLSLTPHTGRTHQLRVHCAHQQGLNAPIVGDQLYGQAADRLYLHAERLAFVHPVTGQPLEFCAKAPF